MPDRRGNVALNDSVAGTLLEIVRRYGTPTYAFDVERMCAQVVKLRSHLPAEVEILYSLNKPEDFILAIVEFTGDDTHRVHYLRMPFQREPDFGVTSVNYNFAELLDRAGEPS